MNAKPTELVWDLASEFIDSRYPTTDHTANPATNENKQVEIAIMKLSTIIGFFTGL